MQPLSTIFTLHHMAASGGTIIARAMAALPGTVVLSEIHPQLGAARPMTFDPLWQFEVGYELSTKSDVSRLQKLFVDRIKYVHDICMRERRRLIIRDHFHQDIVFDKGKASRLSEALSEHFKCVPVFSVRDPLDVWISLRERKWTGGLVLQEFLDLNVELLDRYKDDTVIFYDKFVQSPQAALEPFIGEAGIPMTSFSADKLNQMTHATGDSGRSGGEIAPRKTRWFLIGDEDLRTFSTSPVYQDIVARLDLTPFAERKLPERVRAVVAA